MVASTEDPAVQRRRLRLELKTLRKAADKPQSVVARAMDWSTSKLIRIENGDVGISVNDLRALLGYYEVRDKRRVDEMVQMARAARRDEWSSFREYHTSSWLAFLGFESSARVIRSFDLTFVPGLLQIEEYARSVLVDCFGLEADTAEGRWEARQKRQELLDRDNPPQMFFLLDEAVIRRQIGGPETMRRQLRRVREVVDLQYVTVQVVPFALGAYGALPGTFIHLEFPRAEDDDLLYLEQNPEGVIDRDDSETTGRYLDLFFDLEEKALSPQDTRDILDQAIAAGGPGDRSKAPSVAEAST